MSKLNKKIKNIKIKKIKIRCIIKIRSITITL